MASSDRRSLESLRDDLAALRIDRSGPSGPRLPAWAMPAAAAVIAIAVALGAFTVYRATIGRISSVRVAYATRVAEGEPSPAGAPHVALSGSGYVVTESQYISLGVRVAGRIRGYKVREGDRVKKGQVLVDLDARPLEVELKRFQAQRSIAEANLALYRKELRRLIELRVRDVSSESQVDLKQNQVRVAQAELAQAEAEISRVKLDIEDTHLRSPVDGLVLEKLKEIGEMATPGGFAGSGELIRLANLEEVRAEVDVNESDLAKVALGQDAQVTPDADPGRHYDARVVKLAAQVNRQKGTLRVEVHILKPDAWLRPDMSVRINFLQAAAEAPKSGAVLAPAAAIHPDPDGSYAWVVTQGRVTRKRVQAVPNSGDPLRIASGLLGGEALVVGDASELRDGQRVKVEP